MRRILLLFLLQNTASADVYRYEAGDGSFETHCTDAAVSKELTRAMADAVSEGLTVDVVPNVRFEVVKSEEHRIRAQKILDTIGFWHRPARTVQGEVLTVINVGEYAYASDPYGKLPLRWEVTVSIGAAGCVAKWVNRFGKRTH